MAENFNYFAEAIQFSLTVIKTYVLSQLHIKTIEVRLLFE